MDYILNEYHRNISNQELLDDIKSTAEKLNKKEKEYNKKKSKNALAVIYNNKIIAFIKRILSFNH